MDTIILGLLMIQKCTIYELRKQIESGFNLISSSSMGSIQAAIKKLCEKGFIVFHESVENSVNKKVYQITEAGKERFYADISNPMRYKEKNMELSKFFYLGFLERNKQLTLIDAYISELQKEADTLRSIQKSVYHGDFDEAFLEMLKEKGASSDITEPANGRTAIESMEEIARYQYATLDLSIAKVDFEINWFQHFRNSLTQKGANHDSDQECNKKIPQ